MGKGRTAVSSSQQLVATKEGQGNIGVAADSCFFLSQTGRSGHANMQQDDHFVCPFLIVSECVCVCVCVS